MAKMSTTSYVILGLLARRPWSAYELTEYMRTSGLRSVWPRAVSSIYREPKTLVEHGYASAHTETHKGPPRAVYTITDSGRDAVERWMSEPSEPPRVEDEATAKILLADLTDRTGLLQQIAAIGQYADQFAVDSGAADIHAKGFHDASRSPISALALRAGLEFAAARRRWSEWATQEVSTWPDDLEPDDDQRRALEAMYDPEWIAEFLNSQSTR